MKTKIESDLKTPEERTETVKTQTYDEFMAGIKRKRSLASAGVRPVLKRKRYKRTPYNVTKAEMYRNVREGTIRINYKKPFIVYDGVNLVPPCDRHPLNIFEIWWKFYERGYEKMKELCPDLVFEDWNHLKHFMENL